jgi:hypothetical protein
VTKWEYCVLEWRPDQATVTVYGQSARPFDLYDWDSEFAALGAEGWELVSVLANPSGAQEYWYYFKRPMP